MLILPNLEQHALDGCGRRKAGKYIKSRKAEASLPESSASP